MAEHVDCLKEQDWGKLWEIIKTHTSHVVEGDKQGGYRDRLFKVELDVKALKERFWQSALIGGVIGALIGSGSRDAITFLIRFITGK